MAHELTIDRLGHAEMFYVRESPWHGLGTKLRAVTEYVDHIRGIRPNGTPHPNWAESALFGPGDQIKQRAFDAATTLLDEGTLTRVWRRVRAVAGSGARP